MEDIAKLGSRIHQEEHPDGAKQIMAVYENLCYVWNKFDSNILVVDLSPGAKSKCNYVPTDTPLFDVELILPDVGGLSFSVSRPLSG